MLDFGRETCGEAATAGTREWLVTNGLGGYAMGTVAGMVTRRYHGLLVAALTPPVGRKLLVTKFDETAIYDGRVYPLFANRWADGSLEPQGFHCLERFRLEGTTPVWTFALGDASLEKRVWMQPGANTSHVQYTLQRALVPVTLNLKAIVNDRDHHANTRPHPIQVASVPNGLRLSLPHTGATVDLLSDRATATPQAHWYEHYFLEVEAGRGLDAIDANFHCGVFLVTLQPGEAVTFTLTTEAATPPASPLRERAEYEARLIEQSGLAAAPAAIRHLVLAADQFIVTRPLPGDPGGRTVIAGYPWFNDWGRDTMIALPGLTLATRRFEVAAKILRTFAQFVSEGMLPNNFPDANETPGYNTVDATLWYFEAVRAYHAATGDAALVRDLYPVLADIIDWHVRGTRYRIHVDPRDGLLYAGEPGVQLTWMDVKIDDWVVTPRIGKPVEINALWFNALRVMAEFATRLDHSAVQYLALAEQARAGFARFWNPSAGYCYDVLDGPNGPEATLRPNQLFAVSLPHSPLTSEQQRAVVEVCARKLLTSLGLRTLPPDDPNYHPRYNGDRVTRDTAYHQGTVWPWLIGPFVSAHYRVFGDRDVALSFLDPLLHHLNDHGLGTISEVADADPPHTPHACPAQAWSVAEVLRAWREITGKSRIKSAPTA
jgi:predicted glycogen debranching enzyme